MRVIHHCKLLILILLPSLLTVGQKPCITNDTYKSWDKLSEYGISDDGKYVWYSLINHGTGQRYEIASIDGKFHSSVQRREDIRFPKCLTSPVSDLEKKADKPTGRFKVIRKTQKMDQDHADTGVFRDVTIWNYIDQFIQPFQITLMGSDGPLAFLSDTISKVEIPLEQDNLRLYGSPGMNFSILKTITSEDEAYWRSDQLPTYFVINHANGKLTPILKGATNVELSPDERYVTWIDTASSSILTHELSTGITRHIALSMNGPVTISGHWLPNDSGFIAYDQRDIWKVDPAAQKKPINLTSQLEVHRQVRFRLAIDPFEKVLSAGNVLFAAFNSLTKENALGTLRLQKDNKHLILNWQPYLLHFPGLFFDEPPPPIKAKNADVYVLTRQDAHTMPQVVITKDFKTYKVVANMQPQHTFNWLTAELINWTTGSGKSQQGILYKPENFDTTRKYPVIINYYESRSQELHKFLWPELSGTNINIPWYVSNGYIVFVPDIQFRSGHFAEDVKDIVETGLHFLQASSWIDREKIGLQGHSFGGYITNILATQTHWFAAAQASSALSDLFIEFGGLGFGGNSLITMCERGQLATGTTPWAAPSVYLENSATPYVGECTTPILLMHGQDDGIVAVDHSVMLFNSLRRLQKPIWLLQYDRMGHVLNDEQAIKDYTIRQQQFFDHYLKGKPAPIWMIEGVPAKYKGLRSGLGFSKE